MELMRSVVLRVPLVPVLLLITVQQVFLGLKACAFVVKSYGVRSVALLIRGGGGITG